MPLPRSGLPTHAVESNDVDLSAVPIDGYRADMSDATSNPSGDAAAQPENAPADKAADKQARPENAGKPKKPEGPPTIGIDHFADVELRLGRVVEAGDHPNADRLVVMKVDVGEAEPRQIVAGIRKDWEPDDLVGRVLVICVNLKPARLRGVESQGMMLAVEGDEKVLPLTVDGPAPIGTRVT